MEPHFEQKPSVEFDSNKHHILKAEDVVFALAEAFEKNDHEGLGDVEYIEWAYEVLAEKRGLAMKSLLRDASQLEAIAVNGIDDAYARNRDILEEVAQDMRRRYYENAVETAAELTMFIRGKRGLFLWSESPDDIVQGIDVSETQDDGSVRPVLKSHTLFMDVSRLAENYRAVATDALY